MNIVNFNCGPRRFEYFLRGKFVSMSIRIKIKKIIKNNRFQLAAYCRLRNDRLPMSVYRRGRRDFRPGIESDEIQKNYFDFQPARFKRLALRSPSFGQS